MEENKSFEQLEAAAKRRKQVVRILTYGMLGIWALVVLFPFYWMLLSSVKSYSDYNSEYIPAFFTLSTVTTSISAVVVRENSTVLAKYCPNGTCVNA